MIGNSLASRKAHTKNVTKQMIDHKISIDTTCGKFKDECKYMLQLIAKVEARLERHDPQILASETTKLMIIRFYYIRCLTSLQNHSILDHSNMSEEDWDKFIDTNRRI